jgi:WD40 repeat protein
VIRLRRAVALGATLAFLVCTGSASPAVPRPAPDLVVKYGNKGTVSTVALDSVGRLLASASDNGLFIWDLASGHMLRRLSARATRTAGFSRDGKYVLDGLHLYDLRSGRIVGAIDAPAACLGSFARSADGRWLAAVTEGGDRSLRATIWDLRAPGVARRSFALHPPERLRDANTEPCPTAFSPDGTRFYSDLPIVERDTATGTALRTIAGAYDSVLGYSPDGRNVMTGASSSRTALLPLDLRALNDGHVVRSWGRQAESREAAFSLDGKFFALNSFGGVSVNEVATGKERHFQYSGVRLSTLALDRDGSNLIAGSLRGDLSVADLARGAVRQLWSARAVTGVTLSPNRQWLVTVHEDHSNAWSLAGGRQALVDLTEGYSIVWDLSTGQPASTVPKACEAIAFSSDSLRFACWSKNVVDILDTASLLQVKTFLLGAVRGSDGTAVFYPNQPGKHAFFLAGDAALAVSQDGPTGYDVPAVAVLDLRSGEVDGPLAAHAARAAIAPSAGGRAIAWIESDGLVREYDPASRATRSLGQIPAPASTSAAGGRGLAPSFVGVAPGGRYALGALGKTLPVYDLEAGAKPAGEIAFGATNARVEFLGFSSDGALAAFAESSGAGAEPSTFVLVAVPSGRSVGRFTGRTAALRDFTLSRDRTLLIGAASDGTVQLWDVRRARQTGILFAGASDAGTWLVSAPNGAFDSSPAAWDAMLWRFNDDTFDVAAPEAFFNDFYDPGLLADLVAGRSPPNGSIAALDRRSPTLAVTVGDRPPYGRHVRVSVRVAEARPDTSHRSGSGVNDVRLMRNGSLVKLWTGDVLHGAKGATLETTVTLVSGSNVLSAYAFNRDGVRSAIKQLEVSAPQVPARKGDVYVLTIGLDRYANQTFQLHYAGADADAFGRELRAQSAKLATYAAVRPIPLSDAHATKQNILAALTQIAKRVQPEDAVFIFFAGHGMASAGRFYLLPYDLGYRGPRTSVSSAGVEQLAAHGVSDLEVARALEPVDARDIVLVIDACQSGQALGADKRIGPLNAKGLAQLAYDKGMYVLAAAQSYQAAIEDPYYGHGLLTYALVVEALNRHGAAPGGGTGVLLVQPWFAFAQRRVPELQRRMILEGSAKGISVGFAQGEPRGTSPLDRRLQRPRIYFPRSAAARGLPIARFP